MWFSQGRKREPDRWLTRHHRTKLTHIPPSHSQTFLLVWTESTHSIPKIQLSVDFLKTYNFVCGWATKWRVWIEKRGHGFWMNDFVPYWPISIRPLTGTSSDDPANSSHIDQSGSLKLFTATLPREVWILFSPLGINMLSCHYLISISIRIICEIHWSRITDFGTARGTTAKHYCALLLKSWLS